MLWSPLSRDLSEKLKISTVWLSAFNNTGVPYQSCIFLNHDGSLIACPGRVGATLGAQCYTDVQGNGKE